MRHLKRFAVAMLVVAMILSTAGFAAAAPTDIVGEPCEEAVEYLVGLGVVAGYPDGTFKPDRTLTRAEVAKIIVLAKLGAQGEQMAGYLKGAYSFSDVPATHWASGYIKLAQNLGIINGYPDGTYKPENNVTYAELIKMLVEAAGIPAGTGEWPTNYLTPAQAAGITGSMTEGWTAGAPATRGDMAMGTAFTVKEVPNPTTGKTLGQSVFGESAVATLTVTPEVANVGVGQGVTFTVAAKDADDNPVTATPTFTTSDMANSAVSTGGLFVASKAGTYIVTVNADGKTATVTVNVYGKAAALKITPATSEVPANELSTVELVVEVVDANGYVVASDNTTEIGIDYTSDGDNDAVLLPGTTEKTVVNGKATFKVTATGNSGRTDIIEAYDLDDELTSATCEITTVDQVAGSLKLTASPKAVSANRQTKTDVTVEVLDQAGKAMVFGVFNLTLQISGPGTWDDDGDKTAQVLATDAEGVLRQEVWSVQGSPGTITVTASGEGLTAATIDIESVVAGAPAGIKLEVLDNSLKAGEALEDDAIEFRVVLVDAQGRPTVHAEDIFISVKIEDGTKVLDLDDEDFGMDPGMPKIPAFSTASEVIKLYDADGVGTGNYVIRVRDSANKYPKATFTATVTPGAADKITISAPPTGPVYMLVGNSTASISVRVQDENSNNVPEAGVEISGRLVAGGQMGNAYLNGTKMTAGTTVVKVKTDSSGIAVFNVTSNGYVGDTYKFEFISKYNDDWDDSLETVNFVVADRVARGVEITLRSHQNVGDTTGAMSTLGAGETGYLHIRVRDQNNQTLIGTSQRVRVSFNKEAENIVLTGVTAVHGTAGAPNLTYYRVDGDTDEDTGWLILEVTGAKTGTFTVTGQARQVSPMISGTRNVTVKAGTQWAGFGVQLTDGNDFEGIDIAKNSPYAFRVFMTDQGGNPIVVTSKYAYGGDEEKVLGVKNFHHDLKLLVTGEYKDGDDWVAFDEDDDDLWEVRTSSGGYAVDPITFSSGTVYKTVYIVFGVQVRDVTVTIVED